MSDQVLVAGVPEGLRALAISGPDGNLPRDRRGRVKLTRVRLTASSPERTVPPGEHVPGVRSADLRWAIDASSRRWTSISARAGAGRDLAVRLAQAGVVDLVCSVDDTVRVGEILRWELTPPWAEHRRKRRAESTGAAQAWRQRAESAANEVRDIDAGLAEALVEPMPSGVRFQVLVYAAEDLVSGITHDGPRAFSQAHFGDTKARDDAPQILADAGAAQATLIALGLRRSPYVGLGGRVLLRTARGTFDMSALDGPTQFRADQRPWFDVSIAPGTTTLVVIENLQAAEYVCDTHPDVAVLWCAGQPSDAALRLIRALAEDASRVVIATDADLGGVRIARRITSALPDCSGVEVLDAGHYAHAPSEPFGSQSIDGLTTAARATDDAVSALARACLARGYPVEQEATIRRALADRLR